VAKPKSKDWPELAKAWNDYGLCIGFDDVEDMKARSDACYVVCMWKDSHGSVNVADLAAPRPEGPWEFQNDNELLEGGMDEWKSLRIVPECDWYTTNRDTTE
jgi:hypothetical protein